MFVTFSLILFVIGLIIGSFLNVVIYRTIQGESWVVGRSKCEFCGQKIHWYDNIPLLSFVILRGRCRACAGQISLIHPVIEVLTGLLFVWWYWGGFLFFRLTTQPFQTLQPLFWLMVGLILLAIVVADSLHYIIPDLFVLTLFAMTAAYRLVLVLHGVMQFKDLQLAILGMGLWGLFFWALWFFTKGKGLGLGDVKLVIPLALILGWPKIVVGMFLAFVIGAVCAIALVVSRQKAFGQIVPFGPFLVLGAGIALIWGDNILRWYLHLL